MAGRAEGKETRRPRGSKTMQLPSRRSAASRATAEEEADWELSPAQRREIDRRIADMKDPLRYLLVQRFGPRWTLYYILTDNVYVQNNPARATLFKRRDMAEAVRALLGKGVQVLRCSSRLKSGVRIPVMPRRRAQSRRGRS